MSPKKKKKKGSKVFTDQCELTNSFTEAGKMLRTEKAEHGIIRSWMMS